MSRPSPRRASRAFEHLAVIAAYALVAVVLSFPLITQFADYIPGVDGDVWSYLWAMGWARAAALDLSVNPFHSDYVFYPLGGATQLLWGTALPSFASIPLQLAFGLVPAFNFAYLAASILTGYGTYLLALDVLTDVAAKNPRADFSRTVVKLAAFLAGLIFAFSALRLGYGLAFTNLFHTEFVPFYLLFLKRLMKDQGTQNGVLAGLFFALNVYVDFQIAAFLGVLTLLWILFTWRGRLRTDGLVEMARRWAALGVAALVFSLPMLGILWSDMQIEGGNYIRVYPLRYSTDRSYDLLSYVLPNARSTLYASFSSPRVERVNASASTPDESEFSPDRQAFLGIIVSLLALLGVIRFARPMLFWIAVVLLFGILSFGPVLHIAGANTGVPLPYALLNNIPILNHIRIPMRYGLLVFLGMSLLASAGTMVILSVASNKFSSRNPVSQSLIIPLSLLILAEAAVLPFPTLAFNVPPIYYKLARAQGDFTILEIPTFNWRFAARNEAYQPIHQKRLLRAYTNRIAPDLADYFSLRQTPILVQSLRVLEGAEQGELSAQDLAQDKRLAPATLRFFNLRYALVHRDQLTPDQAAAIDSYLREILDAQVIETDGSVIAYQFPDVQPAPTGLSLDLGENANLMYLGRGWQTEPWANVAGERGRYLKGQTGELYFDATAPAAANLDLRMFVPDPLLPLSFSWDGQSLAAPRETAGWVTYGFALPVSNSSLMNRLLIERNSASQNPALHSIQIK